MARFVAYIDRWMAGAYPISARGLALYRVAYSLFLFGLLFPSYRWVGNYPDAFWRPPVGPFRLLNGSPPVPLLAGIEVSVAVSLVAVLVGYRTRLASYAVGLLMLIGDGFIYSAYQVEHHILVPLVPIALGYAGWGARWSIDSLRRRSRPVRLWPISLLLAGVGIMMTTSGLAKIVGGWLDPSTHAVLGFAVGTGRSPLIQAILLAMPGWLVEALDWMSVALELSFVLALLVPAVGRIVVSLATLFHLAIMLTLVIPFMSILLAYAVLLPWTQLATGAERWIARTVRVATVAARHPLIVVGVIATVATVVEWSIGPPINTLLVAVTGRARGAGYFVHVAAAGAGVAYLLFAARSAAIMSMKRGP